MAIQSINPANGETLAQFDEFDDAKLEACLARATEAFGQYRRTRFEQRAEWLRKAADIMDSEAEDLARMMVEEMGKPFNAAVAEAKKCAWVCRYYADNGAQLLADETIETEADASYVRYLPLGPILAAMPWNFPFWQVFRFAATALMAGNVGLLKHASNVPQCALAIEQVLQRAGFADGVFQTLLIGSSRVDNVLKDSRIKAATLTGSVGAGAHVASTAGVEIKKSVMELGGSDPFIVMPSADIESAAATAVTARTINNGQSCIAAKRFIVHADVYDEFVERMVDGMEALKIGDPMERDTQIGPLATADIANDVAGQVERSIAAGAQCPTGGERIAGPGNYYRPTVLTDIPENAPAYSEEVFGPVASVFKVNDIDEAIRLANGTEFGLGSSAWTRDADEQERFIDEIEAGQTFINAMVASDPRLPFGGVKRSGYGRELSRHGIQEFVNIKTISVSQTGHADYSQTE